MNNRNLVVDLEANGLLVEANKLWCISVRDLDSDQEWFDDVVNGIYQIEYSRDTIDTLIGHNITGYDIHILNRLTSTTKFNIHNFKLIDTALLSRMLFPLVKGKGVHSLKAWGKKLGLHKGEFNDWHSPSPEMYSYCKQDTNVTKALASHLLGIAKGYGDKFINEAITTYNIYSYLLGKQQEKGVAFDKEEAEIVYKDMRGQAFILETAIIKSMPQIKDSKHFNKCKKEGRIESFTDTTYCYIANKHGLIKEKEFKFDEPNPNSPEQIKDLLISLGWKPTKFSLKTKKPKLDKDIIDYIDYPVAKDISKLRKLNKKMGFIKDGKSSWINSISAITGRIHGSIIVNGAKTGRCTAGSPNTQQIPKAKVDPRLRSLWVAEQGKILVASDASQLELRIQAHYLSAYDNGEYAKLIIDDTDMHEHNRVLLGMNDRGNAKGIKYGYDYGAGDIKLGLLYSMDQHLGILDENKLKIQGAVIRNKLEEGVKGLKYFKSDLEKAYKEKGFIKSLLGRPLFLDMIYNKKGILVPKMHAVLNLLIQAGAADIMAKTCELFYFDMYNKGLLINREYDFVLNIHDEIVIECLDSFKEVIAEGLTQAWKSAGEYFKMKCEIKGETRRGKNLLEVK